LLDMYFPIASPLTWKITKRNKSHSHFLIGIINTSLIIQADKHWLCKCCR